MLFAEDYRRFLGRCLETDERLVWEDVRATYRRYFQTEFRRGPAAAEQAIAGLASLMDRNRQNLEDAGVGVWSPEAEHSLSSGLRLV